jgi:hypothetical protein
VVFLSPATSAGILEGMTEHQREHGCRGRLVIYSRGTRGTKVTLDCAPRETEEVGRLIRRWQLRLEARGLRFERFRLQRKAAPP